MFKKLSLKINISILITLSSCCLSIYLILVSGIFHVLETHYIGMAQRHLEQKAENLVLFQESIESIATQISDEMKIKNLLNSTLVSDNLKSNHYSLTRQLISDSALIIDGMILPCRAIQGAAVFSALSDIIVTSEGLPQYAFELLQSNAGIQNFLRSSRNEYWSVRNENIPDYYKNSRYRMNNGIVSFVKKILNSRNDLLGCVVIDISPEYFYGSFSTADSDSLFRGTSVTVIGSDLRTIPGENSDLFRNVPLSNEGLVARSGSSLKFVYSLSQEGMKVGIHLPTYALNNDKLKIFISSTMILLLSLVLCIAISVFVSVSIVNPVRKLHKAMQHPSDYI